MKFVSVLNLVCKWMEIQRLACVSSQIPTSDVWNCIVMNLKLFPGADSLFCCLLLFVYPQLFYEETFFRFNYL